MGKEGSSVKPKVLLIMDLIVLIVGIIGYLIFYNYTYSSLGIKLVKDNFIEYGSKEYNLEKFIKNSNGTIDSIEDRINTKKVGKQQVNVTLRKYNISKTISFYVDIVDKVAPTITLKNDKVTITKGDSYNLGDNIVSVIDDVDGVIEFQNSDIKSKNYYTINSDFDNNVAGTYQVQVFAYDKSNNMSSSTYSIVVEEPIIEHREVTYVASPGNNSVGQNIANSAYSLVGSPYASGGNSPSGFDCSGFVQYVYSINGLSISRSSITQINDGVGISLENAMPGDILIWGYADGTVTHSALYVGGDTMIHAANPSTGVIVSSISGWIRGSNVVVLSVRRVVS